ncbi:two-component sensor histidine kinase [Streptacidiphilus pinicola]|uniref:histidine kinase n=1 Tax=Streptacidiphilus pinicola TaxID=2219663 RepID=A0A2X0J2D4_9ACTN|nr:HAMP domain-containing sensor histidine kinase [Streptacidiphilus pinicola]RAG81558.1 two-component sensor histidine kinase [Streptacidiphilus pinicola]
MSRLRANIGLRLRFAIAFAGLAALVTVLVGGLGYTSAASLIRQDRAKDFQNSLSTLVGDAQSQDLNARDFLSTPESQDHLVDQLTHSGDIGVQVLGPDGRVLQYADKQNPQMDPLPTTAADARLARSGTAGKTDNVNVDTGGDRYRVVTVSLGGGRGAVMLSERLSATDDLLGSLMVRIALTAGAVMVMAGAAGWWIAGRITRRLVRLTATAEQVAATGELTLDVPQRGRDEIGRLARAFDDMLGRLARSKEDQRRLVQDAGHELRTPLTSLRTNIAALRRMDRLSPSSRGALLDDLETETRELTVLVNELVELANDRRSTEEATQTELDELAERVADLTRRRTGREIVVQADPVVATVRPQALQRALTNLVENAAKFSSGPAEIRVLVRADRITVLDRGPGLQPEDLDRIFDRFYRATAARSLPGSGLGLSIVREVAEEHGGEVFARNRVGGGAEIGFTLKGDGHAQLAGGRAEAPGLPQRQSGVSAQRPRHAENKSDKSGVAR